MVPVYCVILQYFWHNNSITSTDELCDNSASTKRFSMIVCAFQFSYQLFVFPLIFVYHTVCKCKCVTVQFIETIDISKFFPCNLDICYIRIHQRQPAQGVCFVIISPFNIFNYGDIFFQQQSPTQEYFCCKILIHEILWSVYTVIRYPNRMVQYYFSVSAILNSSRYVVV